MSSLTELRLMLALKCLCVCLGCALGQKNSKPTARIIGGSATTIAAAPYLVNLQINGKFSCGGSLVTSQHVVTAAHCVKGVNRASMLVTGGVTMISDRQGVQRQVARVLMPTAYNWNTKNMDVAVLKLASPMSGKNISTVGLCRAQMKPGDYVRIFGWGVTSEKGQTNPNQVRTAKVALLAKARCIQQYRSKGTLTKTMFCASVPGTQDACSGDSGGPAIFNGQLCGIVSWGFGCGRASYPGVYTNVNEPSVKSFIQKTIKM